MKELQILSVVEGLVSPEGEVALNRPESVIHCYCCRYLRYESERTVSRTNKQ